MADETLKLCDVDNCGEPAIAHYQYEWGQEGYCCAKHRTVVLQNAQNTNRSVQFSAIAQLAPAPLTRDERAHLLARAMSAEAEIVEVKTQAKRLYEDNVNLGKDLRRETARRVDVEQQLREANDVIKQAVTERDEKTAEAAELHEQLRRLEAVIASEHSGAHVVE